MITRVTLDITTKFDSEEEMYDYLDTMFEQSIEDDFVVQYEITDFEFGEDEEEEVLDEKDIGSLSVDDT